MKNFGRLKATVSIEEHTARLLRKILADLPIGARIEESETYRDVLCDLEYFLPAVLQEIHPEWKHESLDGILPRIARKIAENTVEIYGLCILISDQTVAPIHVRLQIAAAEDAVCWLECRLGEEGGDGMVRTPCVLISRADKRLHALEGNEDAFRWAYKVTFGEQR